MKDGRGVEVRYFHTDTDVKLVSVETVYKGFFEMRKYRLRHKRFDGGWTPEMTREVFYREEAACLLPYDPVRDEVVLLQQFRVGALARSGSPWLLELVAGINDKQESPAQVVLREAVEEAGLQVGHLVPVCTYLVSPGGATEQIHLFCGEIDARKAGGIHGLEAEVEDICTYVFPREQAYRLVTDGRIDNAAAIIALQWLQMNYRRLQSEWGGKQA